MAEDKPTPIFVEDAVDATLPAKANYEECAETNLSADTALLRKLDIHVLPPVLVLYLFTFLDRTNIGNARIQGMVEDLDMHGYDYNTALMVFFIP